MKRRHYVKKFSFIVLLTILTFLTACTHLTTKNTDLSPSPVLDRIIERGELVVGTAGSMPPLNMTTKEGDVIGIEVDIARYIASGMGVKLKIETMPFAELLTALEFGQVDMILSGMTMTGKRNLNVAFVGHYFISGKALLTKKKTIADAGKVLEINSPERSLVALKGSTSQVFIEKLIPDAKLVVTNHYEEAVDMVLKDQVDALVADYPICLVSMARYPNEGLVSTTKLLTYEPIGIAIPAGDSLLINWLENFLKALKGSGALKAIKETWSQDTSWLSRLP
jgi:polar amino acid transport system substrate-binding protein